MKSFEEVALWVWSMNKSTISFLVAYWITGPIFYDF